MTNSIALLATLLACSCAAKVETDPTVYVNVRPGECLLVYRYDSRETFYVDGTERQEHCLAFGPGPVAVTRASIAIDREGCTCE